MSQTITGASGSELIVVDCSQVVDVHGVLTSTPTVTTPDTDEIAISNVTLESGQVTIGGTTYAAGTALTFRVTSQQSSEAVCRINIDWTAGSNVGRAHMDIRKSATEAAV